MLSGPCDCIHKTRLEDSTERTQLGLCATLHKTNSMFFWPFHSSYKGKKEKDYFHYRKTIRKNRHFAYIQIRRLPAVTHIKILSAKHAQTRSANKILSALSLSLCACLVFFGLQISQITICTWSFGVTFSEGGGVLPYIGYIGMCGPKGYGFSAVLVINRVSILADFGHFGHQ